MTETSIIDERVKMKHVFLFSLEYQPLSNLKINVN